MKYHFIDPFTSKPVSTPQEFCKFLDDHPEMVVTKSAGEMNKEILDRIAQLKAKNHNNQSGKRGWFNTDSRRHIFS